MKFAKYLEENRIEEWKSYYVDYKTLKKILGGIKRKAQLPPRQSSRLSINSGRQPSTAAELGPALAQSMTQLRPPTSTPISFNSEASPPADQNVLDASARFMHALQGMLLRLNEFVLRTQQDIDVEQFEIGRLRASVPVRDAGGRRALVERERNAWRLSTDLRDFVELNYTAFYKAAKKHDKVTGLACLPDVMASVDAQPAFRMLGGGGAGGGWHAAGTSPAAAPTTSVAGNQVLQPQATVVASSSTAPETAAIDAAAAIPNTASKKTTSGGLASNFSPPTAISWPVGRPAQPAEIPITSVLPPALFGPSPTLGRGNNAFEHTGVDMPASASSAAAVGVDGPAEGHSAFPHLDLAEASLAGMPPALALQGSVGDGLDAASTAQLLLGNDRVSSTRNLRPDVLATPVPTTVRQGTSRRLSALTPLALLSRDQGASASTTRLHSSVASGALSRRGTRDRLSSRFSVETPVVDRRTAGYADADDAGGEMLMRQGLRLPATSPEHVGLDLDELAADGEGDCDHFGPFPMSDVPDILPGSRQEGVRAYSGTIVPSILEAEAAAAAGADASGPDFDGPPSPTTSEPGDWDHASLTMADRLYPHHQRAISRASSLSFASASPTSSAGSARASRDRGRRMAKSSRHAAASPAAAPAPAANSAAAERMRRRRSSSLASVDEDQHGERDSDDIDGTGGGDASAAATAVPVTLAAKAPLAYEPNRQLRRSSTPTSSVPAFAKLTPTGAHVVTTSREPRIVPPVVKAHVNVAPSTEVAAAAAQRAAARQRQLAPAASLLLERFEDSLRRAYRCASNALLVIRPELAGQRAERLKLLARLTLAMLRSQMKVRRLAARVDHRLVSSSAGATASTVAASAMPSVTLHQLNDVIVSSKLELYRYMLKILIRETELTFPEGAAALEHMVHAHYVLFSQHMSSRVRMPTDRRIALIQSLVAGGGNGGRAGAGAAFGPVSEINGNGTRRLQNGAAGAGTALNRAISDQSRGRSFDSLSQLPIPLSPFVRVRTDAGRDIQRLSRRSSSVGLALPPATPLSQPGVQAGDKVYAGQMIDGDVRLASEAFADRTSTNGIAGRQFCDLNGGVARYGRCSIRRPISSSVVTSNVLHTLSDAEALGMSAESINNNHYTSSRSLAGQIDRDSSNAGSVNGNGEMGPSRSSKQQKLKPPATTTAIDRHDGHRHLGGGHASGLTLSPPGGHGLGHLPETMQRTFSWRGTIQDFDADDIEAADAEMGETAAHGNGSSLQQHSPSSVLTDITTRRRPRHRHQQPAEHTQPPSARAITATGPSRAAFAAAPAESSRGLTTFAAGAAATTTAVPPAVPASGSDRATENELVETVVCGCWPFCAITVDRPRARVNAAPQAPTAEPSSCPLAAPAGTGGGGNAIRPLGSATAAAAPASAAPAASDTASTTIELPQLHFPPSGSAKSGSARSVAGASFGPFRPTVPTSIGRRGDAMGVGPASAAAAGVDATAGIGGTAAAANGAPAATAPARLQAGTAADPASAADHIVAVATADDVNTGPSVVDVVDGGSGARASTAPIRTTAPPATATTASGRPWPRYHIRFGRRGKRLASRTSTALVAVPPTTPPTPGSVGVTKTKPIAATQRRIASLVRDTRWKRFVLQTIGLGPEGDDHGDAYEHEAQFGESHHRQSQAEMDGEEAEEVRAGAAGAAGQRGGSSFRSMLPSRKRTICKRLWMRWRPPILEWGPEYRFVVCAKVHRDKSIAAEQSGWFPRGAISTFVCTLGFCTNRLSSWPALLVVHLPSSAGGASGFSTICWPVSPSASSSCLRGWPTRHWLVGGSRIRAQRGRAYHVSVHHGVRLRIRRWVLHNACCNCCRQHHTTRPSLTFSMISTPSTAAISCRPAADLRPLHRHSSHPVQLLRHQQARRDWAAVGG